MRNCVENRGIVVPSYANLRLYGCGFELSVTLHITSAMLPYLRDVMGIESNGYKLEGFGHNGKYYATVVKFSDWKDFDQQRIFARCRLMLKALKVSLRDAKIRQLSMEMEEIKNEII